ncbi:MAG TPA: substrate-binding domain-containing protein [Hyphomicrobiaceae bacterium]
MKRRPTIRDVAKAAGVSVGSVSRVLNGGPYASPDLQSKVARAISDLDYQPDVVAQSMRLRSTQTIGCMLSEFTNPMYAEIVDAIEERLQREGYLLVCATTRNDAPRETAMISSIRRRRMDGLIVMAGNETFDDVNKALVELEIPTVLIDREVPVNYDAIYVDHRGGAIEATRYLIGLGHKRIALLMPSVQVRPGRERAEGYKAALREAGLPVDPNLIRPQKASTSFAFSEVDRLLQSEDPPTAIITLGTRMLAGVLKAVAARGLSIPDDMSIVSVGDTDIVRCAAPAITAIKWDLAEQGRDAAGLLIEQLNGVKRAGPVHLSLPTELIIRNSCAAPRSRTKKRVRG